MERLIASIAQSLVDKPEAVRIQRIDEAEKILLELAVAAEDLGKVIGKQGRTVRAMRHLLAAAAAKEGKISRLDIVE